MPKITKLDGVMLVHLTYLTDASAPQWCIACMPGMVNFVESKQYPNYHRTDAVQAVTCPACRATKIFEQAQKKEKKS